MYIVAQVQKMSNPSHCPPLSQGDGVARSKLAFWIPLSLQLYQPGKVILAIPHLRAFIAVRVVDVGLQTVKSTSGD
jgi:hypothetical protein